jgi:hypothetical protein
MFVTEFVMAFKFESHQGPGHRKIVIFAEQGLAAGS